MNVDEWNIPKAVRTIRKATLAAPIDSDTSYDADTEERHFQMKWCYHQRECSDNEPDISVIQLHATKYKDR